MKVVILGASSPEDVPGLETIADSLELAFAPDSASLGVELPGSEILLGWDFKGGEVVQQWHRAQDLKWIHWCGAGVDALMFDGLRKSEVILTNAGGIFDRAMAEYVLGYMLIETKGFMTARKDQREHNWNPRQVVKLQGDSVLIFGSGSIGREMARLLKSIGLKVSGVGRSERENDPDFDRIYASSDIDKVLSKSDWVVGVLPSTTATARYFDSAFFGKMNNGARFINVGRGNAVVEEDLLKALEGNVIAGAMLDVFNTEPMGKHDPLWDAPNLLVSPHISGDYQGYEEDIVNRFKDNLGRYMSDQPLRSIVDKVLGFVPSRS